jgi:hypothetical protein
MDPPCSAAVFEVNSEPHPTRGTSLGRQIITSDPHPYFRPSSWRLQRLTPRALALAQQAKANAARAEAEAARRGDG